MARSMKLRAAIGSLVISVSGMSKPQPRMACAWNGFEWLDPMALGRFSTLPGAMSAKRSNRSCSSRQWRGGRRLGGKVPHGRQIVIVHHPQIDCTDIVEPDCFAVYCEASADGATARGVRNLHR